ncbi:MAG: tRNA (adenosine(37)-N6)-threonylcarbamoyltransferase complex ATPase subunit type 1 TsaE [Ruminococcaceae bacterium]|nr:tRNA (adenosine(37)-N6)-threonylcarbamoyltransferase complex ATPase subunit type 1 TsaE [Oscillospiraceae bacterium]
MSQVFRSESVAATEEYGYRLAQELTGGTVVAFFGGMGMGKTAMVRGIAAGRGLRREEVSSPTFALVHDYGGNPPLIHFDMFRVKTWDDLYATGFFDYLDAGCILVVEWSENIEAALPEETIRLHIQRVDEHTRLIERE